MFKSRPNFLDPERECLALAREPPVQINRKTSLLISKCVLNLIGQKCRSIVSIRKVRHISIAGQNVFHLGRICIMDNDVQITELSQREISVNRFRENDAFEGYGWNARMFKFSEQPQKFPYKEKASLRIARVKTF